MYTIYILYSHQDNKAANDEREETLTLYDKDESAFISLQKYSVSLPEGPWHQKSLKQNGFL